MLHVRVSQSFNFQSDAFTVLVFHTVVFLTLIHSCRGQHQVIGPSQPIVAMVGEDVILPCYLDPVKNAFDMTVEWARPDLNPRFVFVWRDGVELDSKKHPSFEGRTSLFTDELKRGNVSLKLSKVKISDEGRYTCFLPELGNPPAVQLVVGAVSSPVINETRNSSGVFLHCESAGWYPEPEVFWLDGEGNLLSAGPTETLRGPDDLYTVSSRVTVEKRHSNRFTCRVQQKNIDQTRETHFYVPDKFISDPPGSSSSSSAPTIIGSVVGILFVLAVVFVVWKWRQNKIRNKNHHEDEETEKMKEKKRNSTSDNSEQKALMGRETDRGQLTTERETVHDQDTFRDETDLQSQTDEETQQRESNNAQCAVNEGGQIQSSVEGGRQPDQVLAGGETKTGLNEGQEETETKSTNENRDAANPAEREGETLNDKEKEKLMKELKTKEGEVEKNEERISRLEKQIQELQEKLEEMEKQRKQKTLKVAAEKMKDEAVEHLQETKRDLERRKIEIQDWLKNRKEQMERMRKDLSHIKKKKKTKVTNKKEEIETKETLQETSAAPLRSQTEHREDKMQEAAEDEEAIDQAEQQEEEKAEEEIRRQCLTTSQQQAENSLDALTDGLKQMRLE